MKYNKVIETMLSSSFSNRLFIHCTVVET